MRDPDLIVRAQQAATALESAWCRWRNMHGLAADPAPAVSSYVGFSLDAPWGQPRIVFGICAEEAEQLATLLDRHDCVGPVHASVKAKPVGATHGSRARGRIRARMSGARMSGARMSRGQDVRRAGRPGQDVRSQDGHGQDGRIRMATIRTVAIQDGRRHQDGRVQDGRVQEQAEPAADAGPPATQPGFVHVPAPAPASAGQQPLAASASSRSGPMPPAPPAPRPREAAAAALTSQVAPRRAGIGTPIALAASRAVEASMASRREAASAQAAAPAPAGPEGATEGGASSDPARARRPGPAVGCGDVARARRRSGRARPPRRAGGVDRAGDGAR